MNRYNLTNLPDYKKVGPRSMLNGDPNGIPMWSGNTAPPAIGDPVGVRINRIGLAKVRGYFVEAGWLGVHVDPVAPPEWYVKQNGLGAPCHVFGAEIVCQSELSQAPEALTVEGVTYDNADDAAAAAAGYPPVRS